MSDKTIRLALVSFLSLFLELLVIRLIGTEIRIFAYLGNLVLLVIFLGIGLGMNHKRNVSVAISAVFFFLIATLTTTSYILRTPRFDVKLFSGVSELLAPLSEAYIWQQLATFSKTGAMFGVLLSGVILLIIACSFFPLGNYLGRVLSAHPSPLRAYSVNVAASLFGMWVYQLFSVGQLPPLLGLVMAMVCLILLCEDRISKALVATSVMAIIALTLPKVSYQPYEGPVTFWSPYQKLTLSLIKDTKPLHPPGYYLEVNTVGYMGLLNLDKDHQATASAILLKTGKTTVEELPFLDQYTLPYRFKPLPQDVLIIGAGAGNDAAGAIRSGVASVDAVEIDPTIIELGRLYHPEYPYNNPAIHVINDDGRAFMERSAKRYDLIVMGLADSHTLSSALTNLRLDHYLYTKESLSKARKLLKPDGILVLSFEAQRPWIGARLRQTLKEAFGQDPLVFEVRSDGAFGWGGYFFVESRNPDYLSTVLSSNRDLSEFVQRHRQQFDSAVNPLTDDWPYLYLDKRRLPLLYILIASSLCIALFIVKRSVLRNTSVDTPMFLWGAAFLLLEFHNISSSSLLFGLTWQTNAVNISAILLLILAANFTAARRGLSQKSAFVGLVATLVIQLIFPIHALNQLGGFPKIAAGGALLNLPFFFAAVIFAEWFSKTKDRAGALGSNLLGAAFGGLLEMFSFLTGMKSLLVLTILLYWIGWISHARSGRFRAFLRQPFDSPA